MKRDPILESKLSAAGLPEKDTEGYWPDAEVWPSVKAIVVCQTEACLVQGIGFEATLYVQGDGSLYCICGRCRERVTDIRGDMTPVGQDKLEELKRNPRLVRDKVEAFKRLQLEKQAKEAKS